MFTGLVETMGRVSSVTKNSSTEGGSGFSLVINEASVVLTDCKLGDSISVNGVCLTVTMFNESEFKVGISPETLRKTNLGTLKVGDRVCLERAMRSDTRFGGHMVQGHVDCTCEIVDVRPDPPNSLLITLKPPQEFISYIIKKGYVCLDGASLTVVDVDDSVFSVMLIAYTRERIVLATKQVGEKVNLEVDGVGKYVENIVKSMLQNSLKDTIREEVIKAINENKLA